MSKQTFILELTGVENEEEAQEFFNELLANVEWGEKGMALAHLTDKGVEKLNKYVLKSKGADE